MKLVVFSHKLVWENPTSPTGYSTDGGFAFQMKAIAEIFDETVIVVPVSPTRKSKGEIDLDGTNLKVFPINNIKGTGMRHKARYIPWLIENFFLFNKLINEANAVHTPIPSDIGTLGMILAKIKNKPLFVRYCGNWSVQKTLAEKFWKRFMEKYAGGINVMFATGMQPKEPSGKNPNIKWIFSTSLTDKEIKVLCIAKPLLDPYNARLIIVSRMENSKGPGKVIDALHLLKDEYPSLKLDLVGDGPALDSFIKKVAFLQIEDKVVFHGKLSHSGVLGALKKAHLFCFPTDSEGFPKVVLEALASGLPVLATSVSAIPTLLQKGGGIVLRNSSPETLAEAIREVLQNTDKYTIMQNKAFETASSFSLENWRDTIKTQIHLAWKMKGQEA